jgi:hypothetical protein
VNRIAEQQNVQQHTLNNIVDRLQILEEMREFYVNDPVRVQSEDPWLDNHCVPLQNEIIDGEDTLSEPLYNINKQDATETDVSSETSSVHPPSIIPNLPEDKDAVPDIEDNVSETTSDSREARIAPAPTQIRTEKVQNEVKQDVQVVEEAEEAEEAEEVEVEEDAEAEEEVEVEEEAEEAEEQEVEEEEEVEVEEEAEEAEEEAEEEEEEGLELEEIVYNCVKYYKDAENFIYSITDDQPSDNAVGYWKEKTKSIAFYKTK